MADLRFLPSKKRIRVKCPICKNKFIYSPEGVDDRHEYLMELKEDQRKINCKICKSEISLPELLIGYAKN